jgi:hypothetical protein
MARTTYVLRDGQLIERHLAPPLHEAQAAPYIRTDGMDPIRSMVSGRMHDSKSAYYAEVKRAGCEIAGNERASFDKRPEYRPQGVGADISRAMDQLRAR